MHHTLQHPEATSWSVPLTLAIAAALLLHGLGWRRLRDVFPELASRGRLAAFVAGMIALWTVTGSPLSTLDHVLLTFHMVQHLLLMTLAAPLILLGRPAMALSFAMPPVVCAASQSFLRSAAVRRIGPAVTHPVPCWLAGTAVVLAWHVPALHELGMRTPWHAIQHATFLFGGILFWWPIIHARRSDGFAGGHAVLYLFLATMPCDALSAFLAFCGRVVYASHSSGQAVSGLSPLQDQELAGALMWFWVTIAYLVPATVITVRSLSPSNAPALRGDAPAAR